MTTDQQRLNHVVLIMSLSKFDDMDWVVLCCEGRCHLSRCGCLALNESEGFDFD